MLQFTYASAQPPVQRTAAIVVLCVVAIAAYALVDVSPRHNGGSWLGYTLGTIGALLIVWLALLGIVQLAIPCLMAVTAARAAASA